MFKKIVICGVGLIGGSFALALHRAGVVGEIVGFGRSASSVQQALQLGVIDRIGEDIAAEVCDADLVFLATPVGSMAEWMARIAPHLGANTLITDGGSTKTNVVQDAYAQLGDKVGQFVPVHPIAGAEKSGAAAAQANLYAGKKVVMTPLPENSPAAVQRVKAAWAASGAQVFELTYHEHDAIFAAVSHLPHLLSFALVHDLAQRHNRDLLLFYAASGFRDFTRIAASSPDMWRDICLANRDALLSEIEAYQTELNLIQHALKDADGAALHQIFSQAQAVRRDWQPPA